MVLSTTDDAPLGPLENSGTPLRCTVHHKKATKYGAFSPINTLKSPSYTASNDDVFDRSAAAKRNMKIVDPQNLNFYRDTNDVVAIRTNTSSKSTFDNSPLSELHFHPATNSKERKEYDFLRKGDESVKVHSLLYPDEGTHGKLQAEKLNSKPMDTTEIRYGVQELRLGDKTIQISECEQLSITIQEKRHVALDIIGFHHHLETRLVICNSDVRKVIVFHSSQNGQFVDFHLTFVPQVLVSLNFPTYSETPILRIRFSDICPSMGHMLNGIFDEVVSEKLLSDYSMPSSSHQKSLLDVYTCYDFRRQSPRFQSRFPFISYKEEKIEESPCIRQKTQKSTFISSYIEPILPEKAEPLFVYPESGTGAVTITTADTPRLEPGVFLNDNLVDFDLRFIYENLSDTLRNRTHLFSSFFYKRLVCEGHAGVRTWTEGINLFSKDFLIIPICEHLHWYLAIICYPRRIFARDEKGSAGNPIELEDVVTDGPDVCYILIFDSLGRSRPGTLSKLKSYLMDESKDKLSVCAHKERSTGIMVKCPRQDNYTDCGLFCCQYFEAFLQQPDAIVNRAKLNNLVDWFSLDVVQGRRQRLKDIISRIASTSTYCLPTEPLHSSDIEEIVCLD